MIRIVLLLVFLFSSLQLCYSTGGVEAAGQVKESSRYEMPESYTWDFGQVKEGEIPEHSFALENKSDKTLTIKDVNSSCGCTVSKVEKKILIPGEATVINVKFKSKGYSGIVKQYVYVHTDSIDKPILKFTIKADVVKQ
ncbi:MAG: DUF1573 domain-containing protein [Candidatus Omnitrophica bacterium]|jgi:hypothetical protein|nr:DUF1573 domain-containing protein [Candidatus Omnitrophota bacterium]